MTTFQQVELPAVQAGEQQKEKRVVNAPNGPPSHDDKTPLDDVPAQRRAEDVKRAGLAAADSSTDDWWKSCADAGIAELARRGLPFQAADVVELLGVPEPDHPNRWGPRFLAAAGAGVITHVGFAASKRPTSAKSILRLWRGTRTEDGDT